VPSSSIVRQPRVQLRAAFALAGALAFALARPARADAPRAASAAVPAPRVVVTAPSEASALLKESLVRAQGELSAVGLGADIELLPGPQGGARTADGLREGVYGLLELEQRGSVVWIHAWAPGAAESLDARVELAGPSVTSEVIAVRAVETLRAAMLQFAEAERGAVPEVVRGFTRFSPSPSPSPVRAPIVPSPTPPQRSPPLAFWAGPALSFHPGVSPDLGAQLGILVGPGRVFAAAAFETTLGDLHLEGEHGSAEVRRQAVWLQLGFRFRPARAWEVATRGGAGYVAFGIEGAGDPGYHGAQSTHGSLGLMLGVSSVYWATRSFGLYGSVGGRIATDAPTILIAEKQVITLDRPSFVLSLGASVGMF
jgi:hypothetical protein